MPAEPKLASPEQLAALVVPAALPVVVRQGTALIWRGVRVVYIESCSTDDGDAWVANTDTGQCHAAWLEECVVDLQDATSRAHVTWAIAEKVGITPFASPLELVDDTEWSDECPQELRISIGPDCDVFGVNHLVWEDLIGLDPFDDTRLPDQSRWVDAEALRLIALHVLGGSK